MHGAEAIDAMQRQPVGGRHSDLARLRIRASIDEADYPHVVKGQTAKISAGAFGQRTFAGHVDLVGSAAGEKQFNTGPATARTSA